MIIPSYLMTVDFDSEITNKDTIYLDYLKLNVPFCKLNNKWWSRLYEIFWFSIQTYWNQLVLIINWIQSNKLSLLGIQIDIEQWAKTWYI